MGPPVNRVPEVGGTLSVCQDSNRPIGVREEVDDSTLSSLLTTEVSQVPRSSVPGESGFAPFLPGTLRSLYLLPP